MKVVKVAVAAYIIASLAATAVIAEPFGTRDAKGPGGRGGPRGECVGAPSGGPQCLPMAAPEQLEKAGASQDQISALTQFEQEQQLKRIDLKANVGKAELALNHYMRASTVDEKALFKAVDTLNQARRGHERRFREWDASSLEEGAGPLEQ